MRRRYLCQMPFRQVVAPFLLVRLRTIPWSCTVVQRPRLNLVFSHGRRRRYPVLVLVAQRFPRIIDCRPILVSIVAAFGPTCLEDSCDDRPEEPEEDRAELSQNRTDTL